MYNVACTAAFWQVELAPLLSVTTPHAPAGQRYKTEIQLCMTKASLQVNPCMLTSSFAMQVLTSMQSAIALVHAYPFIMQPEPLLQTLAQQHGQTPSSESMSDADMPDLDTNWAVLAAYTIKVCAADHFEHVPLLGFDPSQDLVSQESYSGPQTEDMDVFNAQHDFGCEQIPTAYAVPLHQDLSMPAMSQGAGQFSAGHSQSHGPEESLQLHADIVMDNSASLLQPASDGMERHAVNGDVSQNLIFHAPSLSQLLNQGAAPDARRGFDHEVLHFWQGGQGKSDDEVIQQAITSSKTQRT